MKVGEYRIIPKGTEIWSISLQETISFKNDIIVKITNTIIDNDEYCFGILQLKLFGNGIFPASLVDKTNGNIGFNYKKTKKYEEK